MATGYIQVPPDSTGQKVDAASLDVGANSVIRQRIVIADNSASSQFAIVTGGALLVTQSGAVNISAMPTVTVTGGVAVSGTAVVAFATPQSINNISATVTVQGNINISATVNTVIGAGTSNIGTINGISATVNTVVGAGTALIGAVSLAAGTANIGFINGISAPVALAAGTANIGFINNISAPIVLAAGANNIGSINNISATVNVVLGAGAQNIGTINNISAAVVLAAGAANIGFINDISATIDVVIAAGTALIGGVSLVAGTANIGFINNISATVNVAFAGGISIAAGTANIGFLNHISATVTVQGNIAISGTAVTGLSYVIEKTTNSQVQVGDSLNAAIRVNIVAGAVGGTGGTSFQDNVGFTEGTTLITPVGGIFDDVASGVVTENNAGVARITTNRALHMNLRTDGGAKMEDSANTALRVNVVAGSAGGPSIIDNTTYSTGATSIAPSGFMFFSASAVGMTDGRMGAARITEFRSVHTNLRNNAGTEIGTAAAPLSVKVENQSATVAVILAAGTNNIGFINGISSTVTVVGSVVNLAGTANIGGVSLVAGTANIGFINNISATVNVAFAGGISLAAGTANIGFLNGISATVNVAFAGGISLAAGTANIGFINGISATVNVAFAGGVSLAAGTANIGFINNISATVNTVIGAGTALIGAVSNAAGTANIGFINHISATISVVLAAGTANIGTLNGISQTVAVVLAASNANIGAVSLAAGFANVGFINHISATVTVTTSNPWVVNIASASHGPRMVQISTSATATLIAAPGAGLHIYVTQLAVSNAGTVLTGAQVGWSGSVGLINMACAANGGGFVMNFDPPWKVQSNEAVLMRVDPNTSGNCFFNVNFYVAT